MPSQTAATPLPRAAKSRASGPGPLRTARGAGREPRVGLRFDVVGFRLAWLPVLRDRVLGLAFEGVLRDVLLLREPGGEDVRVAMLRTLGDRHTRHRDHTVRVAGGSPGRSSPVGVTGDLHVATCNRKRCSTL